MTFLVLSLNQLQKCMVMVDMYLVILLVALICMFIWFWNILQQLNKQKVSNVATLFRDLLSDIFKLLNFTFCTAQLATSISVLWISAMCNKHLFIKGTKTSPFLDLGSWDCTLLVLFTSKHFLHFHIEMGKKQWYWRIAISWTQHPYRGDTWKYEKCVCTGETLPGTTV